MPKFIYGVSPTSVILRVKLMDSSKTTGAGLTSLVYNSTGLNISTIKAADASTVSYTTAGSTIETITTLGTYAAPTATKCRFKEVDATNHPGVYEIQLADARFNATDSLIVSISGVTNLAQCDIEVECRNLAANMTQILGTAVASPATAGVLDCNVKNMNNVAATSITTINANIGQTQPINFTGTGATAYVKGDMVDIAGAAVSTSTAQIGVNVIQAAGTAWASGAITDAVLAAATYPKALRTATAQSGAAGYIQLDASASATNNLYVGCSIKIVSGTGLGQSRTIILYAGSTQRAYVDRTWATNPANDSVFVINTGKLTIDIQESGVATAGAASTITLASTASTVAEFYDGSIVGIVSGTGAGQSRIISSYPASTRIATVSEAWATTPDNTSVYIIRGLGDVDVGSIQGTIQTARDIGASVLLSPGTGAGQVSLTSGAVTVGTNNDKTAYSLSNPQAFNLTGNITGNLSGSVGSVTSPVTITSNSDITAIKTKTDQLTFTVANQVDANALTVTGANVTSINGSAQAAAKLALSAASMATGTIDASLLSPSPTLFDTSITTAITDHWIDRWIIFTSGTLSGQARPITGYQLVAGKGRFTTIAFAVSPTGSDAFIIV